MARMTGPFPCPSGLAGPTCPPQRDLHGPGVLERVERLKQDLLAKVLMLGRELPVNTLDELIDQLGGPERVAEVSSAAAPPGLRALALPSGLSKFLPVLGVGATAAGSVGEACPLHPHPCVPWASGFWAWFWGRRLG